jgi:hypothetical protein
MSEATQNPFDALRRCLVSSPRDASKDKRDAWVYGIVIGWTRQCKTQLCRMHQWSDEDWRRLQGLRLQFQTAEAMYNAGMHGEQARSSVPSKKAAKKRGRS